MKKKQKEMEIPNKEEIVRAEFFKGHMIYFTHALLQTPKPVVFLLRKAQNVLKSVPPMHVISSKEQTSDSVLYSAYTKTVPKGFYEFLHREKPVLLEQQHLISVAETYTSHFRLTVLLLVNAQKPSLFTQRYQSFLAFVRLLHRAVSPSNGVSLQYEKLEILLLLVEKSFLQPQKQKSVHGLQGSPQ